MPNLIFERLDGARETDIHALIMNASAVSDEMTDDVIDEKQKLQ